MLSMLGIRQIVVLVNKMDLVDYDRAEFEAIVAEYARSSAGSACTPRASSRSARAKARTSPRARRRPPWYDGPTVLEQIDAFKRLDDDLDRPFRMPVQDVYKFTEDGDDRRIVAGTIETGRIRVGDEVVFLPSRKRSPVATIEAFTGPRRTGRRRQALGFTLRRRSTSSRAS